MKRIGKSCIINMVKKMIYMVMINIVGLFLMFLDKEKAKRQKWRIKERDLFIVAMFGGSLGIWLGMYVFHHKTKHMSFVLGIPILLIIQIVIFFKLW